MNLFKNPKYLLFSGKGNKPKYYTKRYLSLIIPNFIYRWHRAHLLSKFEKMTQEQRDYIMDRVDYYCKLSVVEALPQSENVKTLKEHKLSNKKARGYASVYFFDTYEYTRTLSKDLKWAYKFGDTWYNLPLPSITKSRPIGDDNQNSVILKLNKFRHFAYAVDNKTYEQKQGKAIFRGSVRRKENRLDFMRKFHNSTICDAADVTSHTELPEEWRKPKRTIYEHFDYKFIVSLEGNDVASNLKWIMASNSVAVMPRPTCETWFMEGRLIPNVHYIEVAADYSNFEERIEYYLAHPQEAIEIAKNANKFWQQFQNSEQEDIISHLVLRKYFKMTAQGDV